MRNALMILSLTSVPVKIPPYSLEIVWSANFDTLHVGASGVLFDKVENESASWCLYGSEVVASGSVCTISSVCNSPFKHF